MLDLSEQAAGISSPEFCRGRKKREFGHDSEKGNDETRKHVNRFGIQGGENEHSGTIQRRNIVTHSKK
jgi:hypothetical protein